MDIVRYKTLQLAKLELNQYKNTPFDIAFNQWYIESISDLVTEPVGCRTYTLMKEAFCAGMKYE